MIKNTLFLFLLTNALSSWAQTVSGLITDSLASPLPYSTIALLKKSDSSIVKGSLSDEQGKFEISGFPEGNYFLRVTNTGYKQKVIQFEAVDSLSEIELGIIKMSAEGISLDEVSITVIQKPIEFKHGNIVMNVENSPLAAGNTVLDLLSRIPGVSVQNNEIMVNGSPGVRIYIDDRPQQLSGASLLSMLRSMSSSAVSAIELIKNPPARYDAEGAAGIINIKTKRVKITGFSGSAGYRISQGWAAQHDLDLTLNYKGRKINFFSTTNLVQLKNRYQFSTTKTVPNDSGITELTSQTSETHKGAAATVNLGMDWFMTRKTILGIKAQFIPGRITRTRDGNTMLSDNTQGFENQVFKKTTPNDYFYLNTNVNAEHAFDTLGSRLRFSMDLYAPYYDVYESQYEFYFYDARDLGAQPPEYLNGRNRIDLRIISGRLDFEKKLGKKINLETGIKYNHQLIPSNYFLEQMDLLTGEYEVDSLFTNQFTYRENIAAAYASLRGEWEIGSMQIGLRAENTDIKTSSALKNYELKRDYMRLFPTLSIDKNIGKDHSFSFAYNKRIWRPHYENLNPYYSFNTMYSWSTGNPHLQPQFTDHLMLSHTFKSSLFTSFHYYYQKDPIRGQTLQVDSLMLTIYTTGNLDYSNEAQLQMYYSRDIKKWWNANIGMGFYFYDFNGIVQGNVLNNSAYSMHVSMNQVFSLAKNLKVEFSGYYVAPWLWGGFYLFKSRGAVDLGVTRSFLKDRLKMTLSASDIFFTSKHRYTIDFYNQQQRSVEARDSQRINFSIRFDFGKMNVQERQVRRNDEVKERMGK